MRVSEKIIYENMISNLQLSLERLNKLSQKVLTGKDVNSPSDAPEKIGKILDLKNSIQNIEQYNKNILETEKFLELSENSLEYMVNIFNQAKKIAIQAKNATYTIEERTIMAQDINNKIKELIAIANTKLDDRYIFGGFRTINPAFTEVVNNNLIVDVVYNGDSGLMPEEINKGEFINKNITGDNFKNSTIDIFLTLITLRDNLTYDNVTGINNNINEIDKILNKLIEMRTDIGSRLKRLENVKNRLDVTKNVFYKIQSNLEDIDMPSIISNFQLQQNIYQTAITSIGKILQQTSLTEILK